MILVVFSDSFFFFGDSFVRSFVFPGDVLLMTHGLHLISQALSVPC